MDPRLRPCPSRPRSATLAVLLGSLVAGGIAVEASPAMAQDAPAAPVSAPLPTAARIHFEATSPDADFYIRTGEAVVSGRVRAR